MCLLICFCSLSKVIQMMRKVINAMSSMIHNRISNVSFVELLFEFHQFPGLLRASSIMMIKINPQREIVQGGIPKLSDRLTVLLGSILRNRITPKFQTNKRKKDVIYLLQYFNKYYTYLSFLYTERYSRERLTCGLIAQQFCHFYQIT